YSKSLQPAERNYEIHDKELLAIIYALKHFRHYLQGSPHVTEIWLDHANLKYFTTKQTLTRRQARWSLFLSDFNYIIIPKPGKLNKADALSQRPDFKEGIATDNSEKILLTPDKLQIRSLKINYQFCQYITPAVAHDNGPCNCLSQGTTRGNLSHHRLSPNPSVTHYRNTSGNRHRVKGRH